MAQDDNRLAGFIAPLREAGCRISMFIEADRAQIEASARIGAAVVELHTGAMCEAHLEGDGEARDADLARMPKAQGSPIRWGWRSMRDTGWTTTPRRWSRACPRVVELNIGHFLIGEAIFISLPEAIARMRAVMDGARGA